MGASSACFQSRIPQPLTKNEINSLSLKSDLTQDDIQQWHARFIHCYPNGYLSRRQFVYYYQQLRDEYSLQLKPMIQQLFEVFDVNKDNKLDFNEFVLLNVVTSEGSVYEKVKLIFSLYNNEKGKLVSRSELKELLRNTFDLFDIPSSKFSIIQVIDAVFERNNVPIDGKIGWNQFTQEILDNDNLYQQLISIEFNQDLHRNYQFIQRSERF